MASRGSKPNLTHLLVAALSVGLIGSGCGGGDDGVGESAPEKGSVAQAEATSDEDSHAQAKGPSKEEFVARANEICEQGNAKLQAAARESLGQDLATLEERDAFATETIVPNVQAQIDAISALAIPKGEKTAVNGFLADAEAILDQLERAPESFSGDPFAQVGEDFAAYGLTACAPPVGR